jgi:DNA/RNA-binding domain of Phe-tRNA-synthetase-like protein
MAGVSKTLAEVGQMLDEISESELPPIQAWRNGYAAMGLKPTQYRCAAEALLRRFRKDRYLPSFHPLVDVLNAESMRAAIPIAAFDIAHVAEGITVREATGDEVYTTFSGETEHPAPGEIIFADAAGQAHSRRWVYRQGAVSAVRDTSDEVLIVAEALHATAEFDLAALKERLMARATSLGIIVSELALVFPQARRLDYRPAA